VKWGVEQDIEFNQAAFKHGCTEADIRWAFKTFVFEEPMGGEENKYLHRLKPPVLTVRATR
jgi:hypothetical protein